MIAFVIAAAATAAQPSSLLLDQAAHAIEVHRLDEAQLILARAMQSGSAGGPIDRLLADLAFEKGSYAEAEARYAALLQPGPAGTAVAERAGLAALMTGDYSRARSFITRAVASSHPSWRAWNAKGVLCDLAHDWAGADRAFANAFVVSPQQPEVLNNQGWSLMLRGEWARSLPLLEEAAKLDPGSTRIKDNLELARAALAGDLPQRLPKESDSEFAARLNDAGVIAEEQGDKARAIAAFSQALAADDSWDARAANNLSKVEAQ